MVSVSDHRRIPSHDSGEQIRAKVKASKTLQRIEGEGVKSRVKPPGSSPLLLSFRLTSGESISFTAPFYHVTGLMLLKNRAIDVHSERPRARVSKLKEAAERQEKALNEGQQDFWEACGQSAQQS